MSKWSNARFDAFYRKHKADLHEPCEVVMVDGELSISYQDENDEGNLIQVVWKGHESAPGHFELTAPLVNGRATLHRFADATVLVGEWDEDGESGMWRIELIE